jgi:hypothetical protein
MHGHSKPSAVAAQGELNGDPIAYRPYLRRAGFGLPLDGKRQMINKAEQESLRTVLDGWKGKP